MWKEVIVLVWLTALGVCDAREKSVPLWLLWTGTALAGAAGLYGWRKGESDAMQLCRALVPGTALLILAWATGKAGWGDGVAVMALGLAGGYESCLTALFGGLILTALFSGGLLLTRKAGRNTKIPFVPFLTAGWLLVVCGKWGVL